MRTNLTRMLFGAAAAGAAAVTALGVAGVAAAGAATASTQALNLKTYTENYAGYLSTGEGSQLLFRFVASTLKVSVCQPNAADSGLANVALQGGAGGTNVGAEVTVHCGGGSGSVGYRYGESGAGTFKLSPKAGDVLTIAVYYDQRHGYDHFAVTDTTQGISRAAAVAVGSQAYVQAVLGAAFQNQDVTPPPGNTRVWKFTGSHLTTYNGIHGSITGPWQTWEVIDTTNGTSTGAIVANAPALWNGGQNFSVWLRTTA